MRRRLFLALLMFAAAAGCSTLSDPRSDRGTGVIVSYVANYEQVWATLPVVLKELGMRVSGGSATEGFLLVEGGSWGDGATLFVERIGTRGHTRVEVVVKGTLGINIGTGDLPKQVHDKLALHFRRL